MPANEGKCDWRAPYVIIPLRVLTYVTCVFLVGSIIFRCLRFGKETDPFFYIYTVYMPLFIAMLVVADLKIKKILYLFSFLSPWVGKGFFIVFIGFILFDWNQYMEFATSVVCILVGIGYMVYGFRFDDWGEEAR